MQKQNRPLLLIFAIVVFLSAIPAISLINNLCEYGLKAFSMMSLIGYLHWAILLLFILLYINKRFIAWYIALIPLLDFLRYIMLAKTPFNPYFSEWHYRFFGITIFVLLFYYMISNYKAYKVYTNKKENSIITTLN